MGVHGGGCGGRLRGGRVVQAGDLAVAVDGDGGVDVGVLAMDAADHDRHAGLLGDRRFVAAGFQTGRAACRERVCRYVSISVVAVSLTPKHLSLRRNLFTMTLTWHLA